MVSANRAVQVVKLLVPLFRFLDVKIILNMVPQKP